MVAGNCYVFVLGDRHWNDGPSAAIERNFSHLAKNLGPNAVIVVGHEGADLRRQLSTALETKVLSGQWPVLQRFINDAEWNEPGILIMSTHPNQLGQREGKKNDLILYSSLPNIERKFGSMDRFFDQMCDFAHNRQTNFLRNFEEIDSDTVTSTADLFELKPNVFGFGVNINEWIRRLETRWGGSRTR